MIRIILPAASLLVALGVAMPASASLIGTTAKTTFTGDPDFSVWPGSATVDTIFAEFSYLYRGRTAFFGDLQTNSFTLTAMEPTLASSNSGNTITLTLDVPGTPITGFTATVTGFSNFSASDITLAGQTLTLALGEFSAARLDKVVVDFTFGTTGATPVPEPASLALLGAGLLGLAGAGAARRRRPA